jgi:hypothetical protein
VALALTRLLKLSPPSTYPSSTMSLQQEPETQRPKIDDFLAVGGNLAVKTLRGVNATADWCPPLKSATSAALFIFDEVKVGNGAYLFTNECSRRFALRRISRRTQRNGLISVNM